MTIEKFLSFWSQYNTAIIEGLVALIILLSLYLAYRGFFAKKSKDAGAENGSNLDTAQLEKTLQKILDNQSAGGGGKASRSGAGEDLGMDVDLDAMERAPMGGEGSQGEVSGAAAEEVSQLRVSLTDSQKKVETLQAQLKDALQQVEIATAAGSVASGEGIGSKEKEELTGKVRDLEARLAEYEIISEDIADLSRYREENEDLKKQLDALKAGGAPAAQAEAPVVTPAPEPTPQEEVAAEPALEPAQVPVVDAVPTPEPPAPATESAASDIIDDELMREFAAAVEGQKALDQAATKAGSGTETAEKSGDETNQLMNEFENFVSKKG
ncbi:hypothetical protein QJS83_00485 [Bdellovibrio sp. 22V]|uniref:hypothetical protein n=1 Tax=Bdellovibrio TaxID=958 RepID=UPI002542C92C|nr:hypothetical protein [Bdellovibrio sp. 22V]WII72342.1 hypothetical protein QJS83_00485 [Bdellovibrio sp. 22V]